MDTSRDKFLREAQWIAENIRDQDKALQQEEEQVRKQLNEIKEKRANFAKVNIRLNADKSLSAEDPCPRCWLFDGATNKMRPTGQDEDGNDIFRCSNCDHEYVYAFLDCSLAISMYQYTNIAGHSCFDVLFISIAFYPSL